jgi:hypothetical protein
MAVRPEVTHTSANSILKCNVNSPRNDLTHLSHFQTEIVLGSKATKSGRNLQTFRRKVVSSSSGLKSKHSALQVSNRLHLLTLKGRKEVKKTIRVQV